MWIENGKKLIALEGRDITQKCQDIVFEGGRNVEILRYSSSQAANVQFEAIRERLSAEDHIIQQGSVVEKRPQKGRL